MKAVKYYVCLFIFILYAAGLFGLTGDANSDGYVNIVDALVIAQYKVGIILFDLPVSADVDANGVFNIVDALMVAQYSVGLITQFPADPIPAAVQAYFDALNNGGWQDRTTTLSIKPTTIAGIYTIAITPPAENSYINYPGDFVSVEYKVALDAGNNVNVLADSFKPVYMMYTALDGALLIQGLCRIIGQNTINTTIIDSLWRVRLAVQSLNNQAEVYIDRHTYNQIYKVARDTSGQVVISLMPDSGYQVFQQGIAAGVEPDIQVTGFTRPELIQPPFYQIDLIPQNSLTSTNFQGLTVIITAETRSTEILFGSMLAPTYRVPLTSESWTLYAGLGLWYKQSGRTILHDYDPIIIMTKITLIEDNGSSYFCFTDPDNLSWQVKYSSNAISLMRL